MKKKRLTSVEEMDRDHPALMKMAREHLSESCNYEDTIAALRASAAELSRERNALRETLQQIACYDDSGAESYRINTGSFALFDEPNSVQKARAALERQPDE